MGRGLYYSGHRRAIESTLRFAYRGGWPARLWGATPLASKVVAIELELGLLPAGMDDLRLAFASDLHLGPTTAPVTLDRAFELLAARPIDVLLLGGDYVYLDVTKAIADELEARVARVPARRKLAVLGNHDLWTETDRIERALTNAGAEVLVNESRVIADGIAVVGLDDPWTGAPDGAAAMGGALEAVVRVGLAHAPEGLRALRAHGPVEFFVCGHTHGGHIAWPSKRPVIVPGPDGPRFPHGLHREGETWAFVSRGVGGVELPIRANARPDVVRATLRAAAPG